VAGEADVDVALIAVEYGDGRGLRRDVSVDPEAQDGVD